jgi:hypothetical protein
MANITSVMLREVGGTRVRAAIVFLLGIIGALLGLAGGIDLFTVGGILLLIIGGLMWFFAKPWAVRIGSASGEVDGLRHRSKAYAQKVVDAINQAIVERG